jgi:hypothetical protein
MKKTLLIILILFLTSDSFAWDRVYPGYREPMFINQGDGTFISTPDPKKLYDYALSSTAKWLPTEYANILAPIDPYFTCAVGTHPKIRMVYIGTSGNNWPGRIRYSSGSWYYDGYPPEGSNEFWPPRTSTNRLYISCATGYDPTLIDSDGDGVVDANDPESLNADVWTETTCIDEQIGCHAGVYSQQPVTGSNALFLERYYDDEGKLVGAKIAIYSKDAVCNEVGCVGTYTTHYIGDETLISRVFDGNGYIITEQKYVSSPEQLNDELSKDMYGKIQDETITKSYVEMPGGYKKYGDWNLEYSDEELWRRSVVENQKNQGLVGEQQISELERIRRLLQGLGDQLGQGLGTSPGEGLGTGSDGGGTGSGDGVPWGTDGGSPYADPESTESEEAVSAENIPGVPGEPEVTNIGVGDIPTEFQEYSEGIPWNRIINYVMENNPVTDVINSYDLDLGNGSCSASISTSLGTIELSMCEMQSALNTFGAILLTITTFSGMLMLVRRG